MGKMTDLEKYYLYHYLYGKPGILEEAAGEIDLEKWNTWHYGILIETEKNFFDRPKDFLAEEIAEEVRREIDYLNLNARQSLVLFPEVRRDYKLIARQLYVGFKRRYPETVYLAVSDYFEGYAHLPGMLERLERQMEEKYYRMEQHIFVNSDENYKYVNKEAEDACLVDSILEDIARKDVEGLWKHYGVLAEKYKRDSRYSSMYTKFVFSAVIQALYQEREFAKGKGLETAIDALYNCRTIGEILQVTESNIQKYGEFIAGIMEETVKKLAAAEAFFQEHSSQYIDLEQLARKIGLAPGYMNFTFHKQKNMGILHYLRTLRMEKAKELLGQRMDVNDVSLQVGYHSAEYFRRAYYLQFKEALL